MTFERKCSRSRKARQSFHNLSKIVFHTWLVLLSSAFNDMWNPYQWCVPLYGCTWHQNRKVEIITTRLNRAGTYFFRKPQPCIEVEPQRTGYGILADWQSPHTEDCQTGHRDQTSTSCHLLDCLPPLLCRHHRCRQSSQRRMELWCHPRQTNCSTLFNLSFSDSLDLSTLWPLPGRSTTTSLSWGLQTSARRRRDVLRKT